MRLQIRQLTGPDVIKLDDSSTTTATAENPVLNPTLFTCTLNRDYNPVSDGSDLNVTLLFYDERGSYIQNRDQVLQVNANMYIRSNQFYFSLSPPPGLTGTFFHVQAIIRDTVAGANDVSLEVSSYHTTMKRIHIYREKRFLLVYWSGKEIVGETDTREEAITYAGGNEDAFLHIKAEGMYNETVTLIVHADEEPLVQRTVTLKQNRASVAIRMSDIRARYDREGKNIINVSITATVGVRDPRRLTPANNPGIGSRILEVLLLLCPISWFTGCSSRNEQEDTNPDQDLVYENSAPLYIGEDVEPPRLRALTSTVYINVNDGTDEYIPPSRFRDFVMGYAGHLQGVATIHEGIALGWSESGVARYPFVFYELRLIDLVESEILTIQEAIDMSTKPDGTLKTETEMKTGFDKHQQINGRSIVERFTVNNLINEPLVRKVLHHTMRRRSHSTYHVCRDAWQVQGGATTVLPPVIRYAREGAECPPGGYVINFFPGQKFEVYFANKSTRYSRDVDVIHQNVTYGRSVLAIHRGDSYTATGCTTLYCEYNTIAGENEQKYFLDYLFETDNRSLYATYDKKRLILACIDERHGLQTQNYNSRWYDIIAPNKFLQSIQGHTTLVAGTAANYSLVINKQKMAPGDIVTTEEIQSIRWEYKVGRGGWQNIPNSNGHTEMRLTMDAAWAGSTIRIKAYVTLSQNNQDKAETSTIVTQPPTPRSNQR